MKQWLIGLTLFAVGCKVDIKAPAAPPPAVVAEFDPLGSPPRIPLPNNLAFTGSTDGTLNIACDPMAMSAQNDFNCYLTQLQGFPSASTGTATFTQPIDPASATVSTPTAAGSVFIFDNEAAQPLGPNDYRLSVAADGKTLEITPTRRWRSGGTFTVILFGGEDANGLKGAEPSPSPAASPAPRVIAAPAFFFLRSPNPVLGKCGLGTGECACPADVVAAGDPADAEGKHQCRSVITGLADDQARRLEGGRRTLSAGMELLLPFAGPGNVDGHRSRDDVVLMWSFTITPQPMGVFDPTRSEVPFPNDALLNQMTGQVNLPIRPGDPMAMLNQGLNQLDGFSTTAPPTMAIDFKDTVDISTVGANRTVFFLNASDQSNQPEFAAAPVFVNNNMTWTGQLAVVPRFALDSDNVRYVAVVTSDVKDMQGRNLQPAVPIVAARSTNPLIDANGKSQISSLSDANAAQLEVLRKAFADAKLFETLERNFMVPREKVAMVWAFTTESIWRPLAALEEYPSKAMLSTDVTIEHIADQAQLAASPPPFPVANVRAIVTGRFKTKEVLDPLTQTISFDRTVVTAGVRTADRFSLRTPAGAVDGNVPFVMTLPQSAGPWPVAILQHGLGGWRGSMMAAADRFAQAGWATVSADIYLHGSRSRCTDDAHCVSGTCNKSTGVCAAGLKAAGAPDPLACAMQPFTGRASDCRPVASGAAFVDVSNLFATRDHARQYVLDTAQLVRVLKDTTSSTGLYQQLVAPGFANFDPAQIGFVGQSLGGVLGSLYLAVAPEPRAAVLNVTGGHVFDIFASGSYKPVIDSFLMMQGIQRDTAAFNQLSMVTRWVFDAIDPIAVGSRLLRATVANYRTGTKNASKLVIVQEAGMDATILPRFQEQLAFEIFGPAGLDAMGHTQGRTTANMTGSTYFPNASHGAFNATPATAETTSMQNQAATWISTSGATLTTP